MRISILVCAVFLLIPTLTDAASSVTDIAPSNAAEQPLRIAVDPETYEDGIVRFEVAISSGSSALSPHREGRFVIWSEAVKQRPGSHHLPASRPQALAVCSVAEDENDDGLLYQVQVHGSLVDRATFTFRNGEPHGMPAFDAYEILLGAFMEDHRADPGKSAE